jgi:elongation factor Ts
MPEIAASLVKELRDKTSQSMMECKKALQATGGDMQAAMDLLRKRGLVDAQKKAARTTKEGLVGLATGPGSVAMVEVVCESDFCARNDIFRKMVQQVADMALAGPDGQIQATSAITEAVQAAFAKISENMKYTRGVKISAPQIGTYLHHNGKVGVLVGIDGQLPAETLADLCMHIAFTDPMAISTDQIPPDVVAKEKAFATEQAKESGKPANIAEKMVTGKLNKFLAENALLEQPFVKDDKKKVKEILGTAKITAFARFAVGQV